MARNRYSGKCYVCGTTVDVGRGHFERSCGGWRVIHANCAIENRKRKHEARMNAVLSQPKTYTYRSGLEGNLVELQCSDGRSTLLQGDDARRLVDSLDACTSEKQLQSILWGYDGIME